MDELWEMVLGAYDRIIGLQLADILASIAASPRLLAVVSERKELGG